MGEVVQALKYSNVNAVVFSVRCLIGSAELSVPIFREVSNEIESDIRKELEGLADLLLRGFDWLALEKNSLSGFRRIRGKEKAPR